MYIVIKVRCIRKCFYSYLCQFLCSEILRKKKIIYRYLIQGFTNELNITRFYKLVLRCSNYLKSDSLCFTSNGYEDFLNVKGRGG